METWLIVLIVLLVLIVIVIAVMIYLSMVTFKVDVNVGLTLPGILEDLTLGNVAENIVEQVKRVVSDTVDSMGNSTLTAGLKSKISDALGNYKFKLGKLALKRQ